MPAPQRVGRPRYLSRRYLPLLYLPGAGSEANQSERWFKLP
jgi:hypothetical protein